MNLRHYLRVSNSKEKKVNLRLNDIEYKALQGLIPIKGKTMSEVLRVLIIESYIKERGEEL